MKSQDELNIIKWEISIVRCDLCSYEWVAIRPLGTLRLECSNCNNLSNFENLLKEN